MTEAATQRAEFTDEEREIGGDIAESLEWDRLECAIIDLLEEFPRGRRVIADWLRSETNHVEPKDPGAKYAGKNADHGDAIYESFKGE